MYLYSFIPIYNLSLSPTPRSSLELPASTLLNGRLLAVGSGVYRAVWGEMLRLCPAVALVPGACPRRLPDLPCPEHARALPLPGRRSWCPCSRNSPPLVSLPPTAHPTCQIALPPAWNFLHLSAPACCMHLSSEVLACRPCLSIYRDRGQLPSGFLCCLASPGGASCGLRTYLGSLPSAVGTAQAARLESPADPGTACTHGGTHSVNIC